MDKIDTLSNSGARTSLQESPSQPRPAAEPATGMYRRRTDAPASADDRTDPRPPNPRLPEEEADWAVPSGVRLEPVARQPYEFSFACLLIPRFSAHRLMGDLDQYLREWMRQICVSFDWRLETLVVRPEYMQWLMYVPPSVSSAFCIRTVREQTSRRIFEDFPEIRAQNLCNDFWAPGYMLLIGSTLQPAEVIDEYIRLMRQQQGIQPRLDR